MDQDSQLSEKGYTVAEAVVVVSVITVISLVVLASFPGLKESGALNRAARGLALGIRQAQNMSLAVTQIGSASGPVIPPAVGTNLSLNQPQAFSIFADLVFNRKYVASEDALIKTENFERGVKIQNLLGYNPDPASHTAVHILFAAPEATIFLTDGNGIDIGNRVDIELVSPSGEKRTIVVRTSGQVSIK